MLTVQDAIAPVSDANSYQSLTDARAMAMIYGLSLPDDDVKAEAALISGCFYINQFEHKFSGERLTDTQNTAYPREGATVLCKPVESSPFPNDLLVAQLTAAEAFGKNINLFGDANDGKSVASETVGKLSRSYFETGKTGNTVTYPRFDNALKPLLAGGGSALNIIGGQLWG